MLSNYMSRGPRLNPVVIFSMLIFGSFAIWEFTPVDWLVEWNVVNRASVETMVKACGLALLCFSIGALVAWYFTRPRKQLYIEKEKSLVAFMQICCLFSMLAFAVVIYLTITQRGFGSIIENVKGAGRPYYVTGLTTFVHLSTTGLLLFGMLRVHPPRWRTLKAKRLVSILGGLLLGVAVARGVVGAERLAIYIPFLSIGICYVVMTRPSLGRLVKWGAVSIAVVLLLFVAMESQRSYSIKYERGNTSENVLSYGIKRFVLYYALAMNTGATRVEYAEQGIIRAPIFTTTAYPLGKVLYGTTALGTTIDIDFLGFEKLGEAEGVYNSEFTNISGLVSPFIEGLWVGIVFWTIWGGVAMYFYMRAYRTGATSYDVACYALILTALCDAPRVSLLGATHFLFPFIFLLLFRAIGPTQIFLRRTFAVRSWRSVSQGEAPPSK